MKKRTLIKIPDALFYQEGPGVRNAQYTNDGVKLLNVANLVDGKIDLETSDRYISCDEANGKYKHFLCDEGDLIVASSGIKVDYVDKKMGFVTKEMLPLCMNTSTIRFKVLDNSQLNIRYFMYYLKSQNYKKQLSKLITGSAQLNFGPSHLEKIVFPICNFKKQEEIVLKLDLVSQILEYYKVQISKYDDLIKARFVEMFEKNEWSKTPLIKVIKKGTGISYGIIVPGDNVSDGVPMVRPSDFKNGSLDLSNVYRVTQSVEQKYSKTRLNGDEVLIQVIGQPGQVMLATKECKGMNVTRNLAVIHVDSEILNREYLKQYIEKEEIQHLLFKNTNQSTLKQLPLSSLKQLEVQLPPIELQNQFADFVKQVDKSKFIQMNSTI